MKYLNINEKSVLFINAMYTFASALSVVFVNVYLFEYTKSFVVMVIYTMFRVIMIPIFFAFGAKKMLKRGFSLPIALGLFLIISQLIFILTCGDIIASSVYAVFFAAILNGSGEGFFWLSINSLNQYISTPESRGRYLSILGIFSNIMNILGPLIASFIITRSTSDLDAYQFIFQLVIAIYIIMTLVSFKIKVSYSPKPVKLRHCIMLGKDPQWNYVLLSTMFYGIRESVTMTLTGLLVYDATSSSGSLYSQLLALFALITIVSYRVVARKMQRHNRMKWYVFGACGVALSTTCLVFIPNIIGAILFGVINAIALPMYANAWQIIIMNATTDYMESENVVNRVVVRDIYIAIGRNIGLVSIVLFYLLFPDYYLVIGVLFTSLFAIILVTYSTIYHRQRDKLKKS